MSCLLTCHTWFEGIEWRLVRVDAVDEKEVRIAGRSLFGSLSKDVVDLAESIDLLRVRVEGEIDFSDEGNEYSDESLLDDLLVVKNNVVSFISGCVNKKAHFQKNNILLVGPVNSGKSSVFNRLLGFERAIVSDVPGTTRDIVNGELFYESSSFSVFDSAEQPNIFFTFGFSAFPSSEVFCFLLICHSCFTCTVISIGK